MKKRLLVILLLCIALGVFGQAFSQSKKNLIYVNSGTMLSTLGILNTFAINAGYEYIIHPYFSCTVGIDLWVFSDTYLGSYVAFLLHPLTVRKIDPYLGIGFSNGAFFKQELRAIDLPVFFGSNFFINDFLGLKVQGKLYLLSISLFFTEINAGVVLRF